MDLVDQNIQRFNNRILSQWGRKRLCDPGIYSELLLALSSEDMDKIEHHKVYFNPIFSPAGQTTTRLPLNASSNIISIDLNILKDLQRSEVVALILHELGHVFHPAETKEQGEFHADDYARDKGYGTNIVSSLQVLQTKYPDNYEVGLLPFFYFDQSRLNNLIRIPDLVVNYSKRLFGGKRRPLPLK